jgi:hypothetical protein
MIADWPGRRPGLVFAALALIALGSLFPRGYMPVNEGGQITVSLCSAYGERSITIDVAGKRPSRQHSGSSNCQGIFTGFAVAPTVTPLAPPSAAWPEPTPLSRRGFALAQRFHFDPNAPPQAPPLAAI